jgi:tetratricopeptide (TPR) repeat protein
VLGALYAHYEWNWSEGEKEFLRALELNSNLAWAHLWYGYMLNCLGRFEDALRHGKRAQELDPITPVNLVLVGNALLFMGEDEHALIEYRKALELDSTSIPVRAAIARVYDLRGEHEKAVAEYRLLVQYSQGTPHANAALAYALARAGRSSEATRILHESIAASRTRYVSPIDLAMICVGLGDDTATLDWLDKAYDQKSPDLSSVMTDPRFKRLLAHPRFKTLLQRMGFPAGRVSSRNFSATPVPS